LINILFSDEFAEDFATLGNVADRNLLDSSMAGNDEQFWVCVQEAQSHADYDVLRFPENDDIMAMQDSIDPGKILNHGWKKLRTIWNGVNAEYKAALTNHQ
jgi:hypothetical protein